MNHHHHQGRTERTSLSLSLLHQREKIFRDFARLFVVKKERKGKKVIRREEETFFTGKTNIPKFLPSTRIY